MENVEKTVIAAIVAVIGTYREKQVSLKADLRNDLDMDYLALFLLAIELNLEMEDLTKAQTVQDVVDIYKQ